MPSDGPARPDEAVHLAAVHALVQAVPRMIGIRLHARRGLVVGLHSAVDEGRRLGLGVGLTLLVELAEILVVRSILPHDDDDVTNGDGHSVGRADADGVEGHRSRLERARASIGCLDVHRHRARARRRICAPAVARCRTAASRCTVRGRRVPISSIDRRRTAASRCTARWRYAPAPRRTRASRGTAGIVAAAARACCTRARAASRSWSTCREQVTRVFAAASSKCQPGEQRAEDLDSRTR